MCEKVWVNEGGLVVKTACNVGDHLQCRRPRFSPGVRKICWRRKWQPTPVLLPGKPHGERSLEGHSPWGCQSRTQLSNQTTTTIMSSGHQFSHSVVSDSLWPHESQHARPPCLYPTPRAYSNSCPSSWWCHPAISSSVIPFSSCPQSLPASGSFPMSQLFAWGSQSIGVSASASVPPMNTQDWSPLG